MKKFFHDCGKAWFTYGLMATAIILTHGEVELGAAIVTGVVGLVVALATTDW